jgi:RNA polymerase sigma-70 factor (ECF subfamily)
VPLLDHEVGNDQNAAEGAAAELAVVRAAMAGLSETDQEILRLIGWEELTLGEAATVLGCNRATAAVRLHRARRRLTAAMTSSTAATRLPRPAVIPS